MLRCFTGAAPGRAGLQVGPIPTVTVSRDPDDLTFASRYAGARAVIADPAARPEQAARDLIALGQALGGRPALFFGTDAMLLCISRNREALAPYFRFLLPPADRIEEIINKTRFASLATRLGLFVPRTVTSREVRSAEDILARLRLPVMLKPRTHIGWFQSAAIAAEGGRRMKALLAESEAELRHRLEQMRSFSDDFVIQEYIPGGDAAIFSFHAYLDAGGAVVAHYAGRKLRTLPAGSGESTYLELIKDAQVTRVGLHVVRTLGLVGLVKLDFKRHAQSGELYLLEANLRFTLWNHLGAASGSNLPLLCYADLAGIPRPPIGAIRPGRRWLSLENDVRSFLQEYGPRGELTLPAFLRSYVAPKVYDVFAWDDPWPAALGVLRRLKGKTKKIGFSAVRWALPLEAA